MRRFSVVAMVVALLFPLSSQGPAAAATHPVSIGVGGVWDLWLARSANLGWVRFDIYWSNVNPQPGVWDFSFYDTRVAEAAANGQQILAILHVVPAWAGGGSRGNIG
jgi:hypothetical protein